MIGSVSAHRRANAFAQALDEESRAQQAEALAADPEQARLLGLAGQLASVPGPTLDPEVKTAQRSRLIAAMEAMLAEDTAEAPETPVIPAPRKRGAHRAAGPLSRLRPRSRLSRGVAIGGVGVGVAAGAFSAAAAVSSDALPGDTLYGLKRGMEDLRRGMADDDTERGRIYLDQASTRLNEARRLMERGRASDLDAESVNEIREALDNVRHDAGEGRELLRGAYDEDGSLGPMQTLSAFSQKNERSWQHLRDRLPPELGELRDEVSSVFDAIRQDVAPLSSLLPGPEEYSSPGGGAPDTADTGGSRTDSDPAEPTPSSTATADGEVGDDGEPRPSTTEEGGLVGEDGLIGGVLPDGDESDGRETGSSSPPTGQEPGKKKPEITLPPLLPLPDLGLDIGEEE
ncbi:DUF5667 domain-containing protein [Streptomyces sp. WMMC500]|uniref:DUF5667 domain-containing protein n=1 Tax=Streptomyces sp. WMMC500 TaxID=3015154 RepID=UPI00248C26B4|nr:DUF5667 domain-containing protein [Streptomyces sp. WMMC500]WBB63958.1 DUF5667 domain-containing protein [Streptomyces sp. WMMC500]